MYKKNILITGSSGFVGQNLMRTLESSKYTFNTLSLRDKEWKSKAHVNTCEVYMHLAGIAHDISNKNDDQIYEEVNYELTKDLYNVFLEDKKAKVFIFFSSIKALADQPKQCFGNNTDELICTYTLIICYMVYA